MDRAHFYRFGFCRQPTRNCWSDDRAKDGAHWGRLRREGTSWSPDPEAPERDSDRPRIPTARLRPRVARFESDEDFASCCSIRLGSVPVRKTWRWTGESRRSVREVAPQSGWPSHWTQLSFCILGRLFPPFSRSRNLHGNCRGDCVAGEQCYEYQGQRSRDWT